MADKIYQLPYDEAYDKDIHDWLESIPRKRKAEMVRHALRFYLASTGASTTPVLVLGGQTDRPTPEEKPKTTKKPSLSLDGMM